MDLTSSKELANYFQHVRLTIRYVHNVNKISIMIYN